MIQPTHRHRKMEQTATHQEEAAERADVEAEEVAAEAAETEVEEEMEAEHLLHRLFSATPTA
jgi:hypothetical protein